MNIEKEPRQSGSVDLRKQKEQLNKNYSLFFPLSRLPDFVEWFFILSVNRLETMLTNIGIIIKVKNTSIKSLMVSTPFQ